MPVLVCFVPLFFIDGPRVSGILLKNDPIAAHPSKIAELSVIKKYLDTLYNESDLSLCVMNRANLNMSTAAVKKKQLPFSVILVAFSDYHFHHHLV